MQTGDANVDAPGEDLREVLKSRADGNDRIGLMGSGSLRVGLRGSTGLTDAWPSLEERKFSAREATIVDEFVAHRTTGPAATEHRLIAVQSLFANLAITRLDRKQHRLPIATGFPDTHGQAV